MRGEKAVGGEPGLLHPHAPDDSRKCRTPRVLRQSRGPPNTTVTDTNEPSAQPPHGREFRRVIIETLLVAVAGGGLALVANALSPRGLSLTRNYFPGGGATSTSVLPVPITTSNAPGTTVSTSSTAGLAAQLQAKGLRLVEGREAARLFADPRYAAESVVFVDARDDRHYRKATFQALISSIIIVRRTTCPRFSPPAKAPSKLWSIAPAATARTASSPR